MKIIINKYDNGWAVIITEDVVDAQGKQLERKEKRLIEGNRDSLIQYLQQRLPQ